MSGASIAIGDVIRIVVERLAYGGDGIARHDGLVVFVPLAAPGDTLDARIVEIKSNFARASIVDIVNPSDHRRVPPCEYYGVCGGCQLQHITYNAQLSVKAGFIRDSLRKIGGIEWPDEIEVKSGAEFGYRSRAQFKLAPARAATGGVGCSTTEFGRAGDRSVLIGFHRRGSHSVCDVERCAVLQPELNSALRALRAMPDWSGSTPTEFPSTIDVAAGDSQVAADSPLGEIPAGPITRRIGSYTYQFSASTFFQANPSLLDALIESATRRASGDLAVDLYAGVGLFTLPLASRFSRVIGVEASQQSTVLATANIATHGIHNVTFCRRRSEDWLSEHAKSVAEGKQPAADFMLLDPPRGGLEGAAKHLLRAAPSEVCYVSCNPATLSRDLSRLVKQGYRIESIVGFDLFPQTYHVETVVRLYRA